MLKIDESDFSNVVTEKSYNKLSEKERKYYSGRDVKIGDTKIFGMLKSDDSSSYFNIELCSDEIGTIYEFEKMDSLYPMLIKIKK